MAVSKKPTTDLATVAEPGALAPLGYAIMDIDPAEIGEVLAENTGGDTISPFDLDVVKVPPGGFTTWSVPTIDGEVAEKAIEGVIVFQRSPRAFWVRRMEESGGGNPPDCSSQDGMIGVGVPKLGAIEHPDLTKGGGAVYSPDGELLPAIGGRFDCRTCPLAAFGSGPNGRSQACKASRLLFVMRSDSILPLVLRAPASSLAAVKKYMLRLAGAGIPYYGAVSSFSLTKERNADNIEYGSIVPAMAQRLSPEDTARMRAVSEALRPVLAAIEIDPD